MQDAWARIRSEHAQYPSTTRSGNDISELARATQQQLAPIVQECCESVFQLRSSMAGELDEVRGGFGSLQGQLDALKQVHLKPLH